MARTQFSKVNKNKLFGIMKEHGDTQTSLAAALGITRNTLYNKINEKSGASFTQPEISAISKRYHLTQSSLIAIFFS